MSAHIDICSTKHLNLRTNVPINTIMDRLRTSSHMSAFISNKSFLNIPFCSKNQRDFADSKHTLHFNQYVNNLLPDSHKSQYLIEITNWCFSCIHTGPVSLERGGSGDGDSVNHPELFSGLVLPWCACVFVDILSWI